VFHVEHLGFGSVGGVPWCGNCGSGFGRQEGLILENAGDRGFAWGVGIFYRGVGGQGYRMPTIQCPLYPIEEKIHGSLQVIHYSTLKTRFNAPRSGIQVAYNLDNKTITKEK
jgi:hypothetical protein